MGAVPAQEVMVTKLDLRDFERRIRTRSLALDDYKAVADLQLRCFPGMKPWLPEHFRSQLETFREGQIGVEYQGRLVASSSSLIVDFDEYSDWHNWKNIADNGFIRNHDPAGDTLYGIEIMVDPRFRGLKLARRLYEERKRVARERNLARIIIGGRIPGYGEHAKKLSAREYVEKVMDKTLVDPVLTTQLAKCPFVALPTHRRSMIISPGWGRSQIGRNAPRVDRCIVLIRFAVHPRRWSTRLFRDPKQPREKLVRPRPCHKRVMASLNYTNGQGEDINGRAAVFGWMSDEVRSRNPDYAKPIVCIMDGEANLWSELDVFQPEVPLVEVLDLLHVTPRLWQAAHLFHKPDTTAAERFVQDRVLRILRGQVKSVIRGLRRMRTTNGSRGKPWGTIEKIRKYFEKHQDRMRYDIYLARGYPIASGVIEGACRHVAKDRLDRTGMNWVLEGAQAMLDLRCIYLSDPERPRPPASFPAAGGCSLDLCRGYIP